MATPEMRLRSPDEVRTFLEGHNRLPELLPDPADRQRFIDELVASAGRLWTRERIPPPACAGEPL